MACPSEALLQEFVEGRLDAAGIAALSEHLDGCAACRALIAATQPVRDEVVGTPEPDRIGRYQLRGTLGAGGMGVVYEAFDAELDRVVALKLLHPSLDGAALQTRLVAEARAMAKLSHPHVVSVYDIGRIDEQVYLVMDLVVGTSLRAWMGRPHSLADVLAVFRQAGEGLAAAHSVALVHRDFKPENVLIGDDGRVRVSDFGLATRDDAGIDAAHIAGEGSPAYMAPEQRSGGAVTARSDQYSFCVVLREALDACTAEPPRWLHEIVARGMSPDPQRRFADLPELLAKLARGQRRQRGVRIAAVAALLVALTAGGAFWAGALRQRSSQQCKGGTVEMDALWQPAVAERLAAAFAASNGALGTITWSHTSPQLEAYARSWRQAHQHVCEATRTHGEQSELLYDKKMSCLSERKQLFAAVVGQLSSVDAAMLERVPSLLQLLRPIETCEALTDSSASPPPPLPRQAIAVEEARHVVAQAAAMISAGRYQEGLALARSGLEGAHASHYLPIEAEASLWLGTAHGRLGHADEAKLALEQAVSSASAGHAQDISVRAFIQLMHFVGFDKKRYEEGRRYDEYAEAMLRDMTHAAELDAERLSWRAAMLVDQRRYDDALVASRQQLALAEAQLGTDHRLYASALDGIAGALVGQGKNRDALPIQLRACESLERALGSPHPQLGLCLNNLAGLHANLGEHEVAIGLKQRALQMFDRVAVHPAHISMAHRNLARSYLELEKLDDAGRELGAAGAVSKSPLDHVVLQVLRGTLERHRGRLQQALALHKAAAEEADALGPAQALDAWTALTETMLAAKDTEAKASAAHALALATTLYGAGSFRTALPLRLSAEALLLLGRRAEALPLAEAAVAAVHDAQIDPRELAKATACLERSRR